MNEMKWDEELDCRGMSCPIPILKTKKAVDKLSSGQVLKLVATDPGSVNDVQAWTRRTGNPLLGHNEGDGEYTFFIQKQ